MSLWVRDVELTPEQRRVLRKRAQARRNRSRTAYFRAGRARIQAAGRQLARNGDALHIACCMLYRAEGSKSRNAVQFVNSDPAMVRFFVRFLRECYGLADEAIRIDCNLFADHVERQHEIEQFWLELLNLSPCLRRSTVNVYSKHSQQKRRNRLPYGTVRVVVHSTEVVQSIYGAIQEYAGFERPEWLG